MLLFLIAAASFALTFCTVMLCLGKNAERQDRVQNRLDHLSREVSLAALNGENDVTRSFTERVLRPVIRKIGALLANLVPNRKGSKSEQQKRLLQQAGWTVSVEEYTVLQLILMCGCGLFGILLAVILKKGIINILLYFFYGVTAAYAGLRYFCSSAATRRKNAMEKQLPDMLDLLSVSVAAGLGFERAMLHVIDTMDGPLVDEFAVTYREMSMGRSRRDALLLLGERCGIEDLTSVTGALVQAGQLGIPICNVLQSQSAALRRSRRSKVKEKAAAVSTKMLLPMVGLIFPVLFIILLGPSLITIMEQFG